MKLITVTALAIILAGCGEKKDSPKKTRAVRDHNIEKALAAQPTVRTHNIDGHQMLVVTTPVKGYFGAEYQTCFIWRDAEYKTASMHCGQQPEMDLSNLGGRESE